MPAICSVAGIAPLATAAQIPTRQPGEDADAAEERGRDVVPALARRDGDEPSVQPRREEKPDRERGSRKGGDRREGAHEFGR